MSTDSAFALRRALRVTETVQQLANPQQRLCMKL
jgi:hypothetical protein